MSKKNSLIFAVAIVILAAVGLWGYLQGQIAADQAPTAIAGRVYKTLDNTGIPGVNLSAEQARGKIKGGAVSGGNGEYAISLSKLKEAAEFIVMVNYGGQQIKTKTSVSPGQITKLDIPIELLGNGPNAGKDQIVITVKNDEGKAVVGANVFGEVIRKDQVNSINKFNGVTDEKGRYHWYGNLAPFDPGIDNLRVGVALAGVQNNSQQKTVPLMGSPSVYFFEFTLKTGVGPGLPK